MIRASVSATLVGEMTRRREKAVPGPRDRVSFFEEQERRRRQSGRASWTCALGAFVMGAPSSVWVTPALFFVAAVSLRLLPVPGLSRALGGAARFVPEALDAAFSSGDASAFERTPLLAAMLLLLLPGMMALLGVWLWLRRNLSASVVDAAVMALGARKPAPGDLEEHALVNVVEEMAIAAGVPSPDVRVLDAATPNAAALGAGETRPTVVVTRGLMDRLDRDQTQAIAGHLIGSIGNGDLLILPALSAVVQSVGLVLTSLDALLGWSPSAWTELGAAGRSVLGARVSPEKRTELARFLLEGATELREDGLSRVLDQLQREEPDSGLARAIKKFPPLYVLMLPAFLLYVVSVLVKWQVWILRAVVVGPLVMLVWRSRRYLADAAAVQLTRYPDALARALECLSAEGDLLSRARWCEPVFIVGSEAAAARARAASETASAETGTWTEALGGFVHSHPPLEKRLARLAAMGSTTGSDEPDVRPPWRFRQWLWAALFLLPFALFAAPLALFVLGMSFLLAAVPTVALNVIALELISRWLLYS